MISHEDLPGTGAEVSDAAPVTIESLRSLCVTKSAEKGRDYVLGILAEFGAQRLGDIKPEQYQALCDALTAEGCHGARSSLTELGLALDGLPRIGVALLADQGRLRWRELRL